MLDNLIKIYVNAEGQRINTDQEIPAIYKLSNQSVVVQLVAPFDDNNAVLVKFLLSNLVESPIRRMSRATNDEGGNIVEQVNGEPWGVWEYRIPSSMLAAAAKLQAQEFYMAFISQELVEEETKNKSFVGFYNTLAQLQAAIPSPASNQYAGILDTSLSKSGSTVYTVQSGAWVEGNQTVLEYEEGEGIVVYLHTKTTSKFKLSIAPSVDSYETEDLTNTDLIIDELAELEGTVGNIVNTYVNRDLDNYANFGSNAETLEAADLFFMNDQSEAGIAKRLTYQKLLEELKKELQDILGWGQPTLSNQGQVIRRGYVPLDGQTNPKIDPKYLPDEVISLKGSFGSGGDLPATENNIGDTYICDTDGYVSNVANGLIFDEGQKAIWTSTGWIKVGGTVLSEAPSDGNIYGRKNNDWVNIDLEYAPASYRQRFILDGNTSSITVTSNDYQPFDSLLVYEDGVLLEEGVNYSVNNATGVITFTNYTPEPGSIISVQIIKRLIYSGILERAVNVEYDDNQVQFTAENVQAAITYLANNTYTQTELQTPGQASVASANVSGLNTLIQNVANITWKGTLDTLINLNNVENPTDGDVYAVLETKQIYIYEDPNWTAISGGGGSVGADGEDALFVALTSPAAIITQDANLNLLYANTGTDIYVYEGPTTLNYVPVVAGQPIEDDGSFSVDIVGVNITPGAITDEGIFARVANHSNFTPGSASAKVQYTVRGKRANGNPFQFIVNQNVGIALRGADGTDGTDGTSISLKGDVATVADLDNIVDPQIGDLYIVTESGDAYSWNGVSWFNAGPLQGAPGTDGIDGQDGLDGFNTDIIRLYRRTETDTAPAAPTNLTGNYNFEQGVLTGLQGTLNGFTDTIPNTGGRYLWFSTFKVASRSISYDFTIQSATTPRILVADGIDGTPGLPGPGLVYRGIWNSTNQYIRTNVRTDVVQSAGVYYYTIRTNQNASPLSSPSDWQPFGSQFESVATGLLLAEDATITQGLVIGTLGSDEGFIRSANVDHPSVGDSNEVLTFGSGQQGFALRNDGHLIVGDAGQYVKWNGVGLQVVGDIGGSIGQIEIGSPPTTGIRLSSSGIYGYKSGNTVFELNSLGDLTLTGTINSPSGTIGGVSFSEGTVESQAALAIQRIRVNDRIETQVLRVNNTAFIQNGIVSTGDIVPVGSWSVGRLGEEWVNVRALNLYGTLQGGSDIRLKENVAPIEDKYKEFILSTDVIQFNYKDKDALEFGINANAFVEQFGEDANVMVSTDEEGYYQVAYSRFIPVAMQLIKEQHEQIEELKGRLTALENKEV